MNDREMVVVMDERRSNKCYYRRDCFNKMLNSEHGMGQNGQQACPIK
jgi:hypothetical protein